MIQQPGRRVAAVVVVAFAVGVAPAARADTAAAQSKQHLGRATELHKAGRYAEALDELKTAYALDANPDLLYAIGQVHVKLGKCEQATTFYERYLATKPPERSAALARQAIAVCQTDPPEPEIGPWYTDWVGDTLVGAGVVAGVVGGIVYASARGDLDDAEAAPTYPEGVDLVESAQRKRTYSIILGVGGLALVGGGILRYALRGGDDRGEREPRVSITPIAGGGLVTWEGGF